MTIWKGLVARTDRCIGCFACQLACQQEHALPEGQSWIRIVTIGPCEVDGELAMEFFPHTRDGCDLCPARTAAGRGPFCVEVCPTQALALCAAEEILRSLDQGVRLQICNTTDAWSRSASDENRRIEVGGDRCNRL